MNDASTAIRTRVQDPICGMDVDPATAEHRVEHDGTTYYFCGARCAETFQRDPRAALAGVAKPDAGGTCCSAGKGEGTSSQPAAQAAGKYICPMCPGVESDVPAACPKCGMALELAVRTYRARQVRYTCPMHSEIVQAARTIRSDVMSLRPRPSSR